MSFKNQLALISLLLAGHLSSAGHAQCELARLSPHNAAPYQGFGVWFDIEGDTAVVSARGDLAVPQSGSVYVYGRTGTAWVEQQELFATAGQPGDYFGTTVSISGDTIAVGSFAGKAYVFVKTATGWAEQQILALPGLGANEHFGSGVFLDGNTLVVSAQREGVPGQDSGAAYVFVRNAGSWSLQQRLQPSDAAAGDVSGFSVLAGDMLLLGSPGKDGRKGAIYRFTRSGSVWTQREKMTASDGQPADGFGARFALDGNTLVVAAALASLGTLEDTAAVYVRARSGATFVEQQRIDLRAPGFFSWAGTPIAISGDTFVVAAPWEEVSGLAINGAAYVFTRSGVTWTQSARLVPANSAANQHFGSAVAVSNGTILIGAPGNSQADDNAGLAHVYQVLGANVIYHNGRGVNVDTLTASTASAGQTWTATLGVVGPHAPSVGYLAVHRACQPGILVLGRSAEFLLAGPSLSILGPLPHAGQGSTLSFTLPIPANAALVGTSWAAQGIVFGGPLGLSNAAAGLVQ